MRIDDNGAAIGGLKVVTAHDWFSARPSGTEAVQALRQKLSWQRATEAHPGGSPSADQQGGAQRAKRLLSQVEGGAKLEGPRKINFFSER